MKTIVGNCRLCKNFVNKVTEYQGVVIDYTPILMETENFFLVPDLSPVSDVHLLIVSKKHCRSMSALSNELLEELSQLCNVTCGILKDSIDTDYAIFEHGAGNECKKSFNSINHFHLHIVSFNSKLSKLVTAKTACTVNKITTLSDIKEFKNKEYIFIQDYDQNNYVLLFEHTEIKSQLLRKIIFEYNHPNSITHNKISYNWKKGIDLSRYNSSAYILKKIFQKRKGE